MKKNYKWLKVLLLVAGVVILTACSNTQNVESVTAESTGLWDRYIIYNLSQFIIWLSNLFGGNYGIGIILFTIILRIVLIPLYRIQLKSQREMQEVQPELEIIKEKYPNRDKQSMELMQQEQQQLMSDRGINQFSGFIPLLIQLPVMIALYQAIIRTEEIRQGSFLWTDLGQPDSFFILPLIAAAFTFGTTYLTMKSNPMNNAATKSMSFITPIMILFITVGLPSAIALYFAVTNAMSLVQTLLFNNPYKIIAEREAKIAEEKERERELRRTLRLKTGRKKKK